MQRYPRSPSTRTLIAACMLRWSSQAERIPGEETRAFTRSLPQPEQQSPANFTLILIGNVWWPRSDSNRHEGLPRQILSLLWLPISPLGHPKHCIAIAIYIQAASPSAESRFGSAAFPPVKRWLVGVSSEQRTGPASSRLQPPEGPTAHPWPVMC